MTGPRPILLAAGGTAGHVYPAIALAAALGRRGIAYAFVTDRRGGALDLGAGGVAVHVVRAAPLVGRGLAGRFWGAVDLVMGTLAARRLLRDLAPAAVVGFGGYPSVPPVLAATRLGIPTLIHEQNAVLGRANRLLAARVDGIALAFDPTERLAPAVRGRARLVGNPVRPEITDLAAAPYAPPRNGGPFRVLIVGGSQGARVMADVVPAAIGAVRPGVRERIRVAQQCRPEDVGRLRAAYAGLNVQADCQPFFHDMAVRLGAAHLVIARAGASTVAELAVAGRPAILVPYRFAADDHQTVNARLREAQGGAWAMPEAAFTKDALAARLEALADAPETLAATA
ncbi:MAG: undecaprenyldiphospho-muramoylpentapeptide beta-N-acetylglucosaminyltransferase, partial [Alphaproteobacteria bacterium]